MARGRNARKTPRDVGQGGGVYPRRDVVGAAGSDGGGSNPGPSLFANVSRISGNVGLPL